MQQLRTFAKLDHLRLLVLHLLPLSGKHLEELLAGVLGFRLGSLHSPWRCRIWMRIFSVSDVDVEWVGPTVRRLGRFDSFPFSFQSGSSGCSLADMLPWWSHIDSGRLFRERVKILYGKRSWVWIQKLSMKAANVVSNFLKNLSTHQTCEDVETKLRKPNANAQNYLENPKGKMERDSTIVMTITIVFSGVLGFLGWIDRPFSHYKF